ncbi:MAG: DNA-3-methyladenine glycosylase family protein [Chthoniobacterales bacterium]
MERPELLKIPSPDFDLALTLDSGQTFHWESLGAGFVGTIGERTVYVEQYRDMLKVHEARMPSPAGGTPTLPEIVARYFALDHPLAEICASLPDDAPMREASEFCRGLRIMRQPRWECLATFITSSMKQVAHIRQISHTLRRRYGHGAVLYGSHVYAYPSARRLARTTEAELRDCALGYRAKNLLATGRLVAEGRVNLDALAELPDDELRAALCALPGVGAKVANCVMLFAYERLRAFPIDVWIERALMQKYFPRRRKLKAGKLRDFAAKHFGEHGGYAQQYLFHHARKTTPRQLSPHTR